MVNSLIGRNTRFIDLSYQEHEIKELKRKLKIDKRTLESSNNWYLIDNKWYYYKTGMSEYDFFNELLGEELAKYFDLDTVSYTIVRQKISICGHNPFAEDDYPTYGFGLISENFREKDKKYLNPDELGISFFEDLDIIELLRCETFENYEELIRDIIKLTVFDFYIQQTDRHNGNILFSKDRNNYIKLAKVYDLEQSFAQSTITYDNPLMHIDLNNSKILEILRSNKDFQEQFHNLMNINMKDAIERLNDKHRLELTKNFLALYFDHDERMKKLVKEYKII